MKIAITTNISSLTPTGTPPPPEIKWKSFTDNNTILISWEPPFTWELPDTSPGYPILFYTVTVQDEQMLLVDQHNQTGSFYELNPSPQPEVCVMYSFSITATTGIGEGDTGTAEVGFIIG